MNSMYEDLLILPPPGLSTLKENDLHKKVGGITPDKFKSEYPKPSKAAKEAEKARNKLKYQKQKAGEKRKEEMFSEYNNKKERNRT